MSGVEEKTAASGKEKKSKKEGKKNSEVKAENAQIPADQPEKIEEAVKSSENGKSELEKSNIAEEKAKDVENGENEDLSLPEVIQESFIKGFVSEAEKKSRELRQNMLSQMYEVFRLFDIDRDGFINASDLKFTLSSLEESNAEEKIQKMLNDSPTPIDFNAFIGLFESKEMEFDSERELINAFSKWDTLNCGLITEERFKNDLMKWGDKFSEKDADRALEEAPLYDESGEPSIDYVEFCSNLCGLQNVRKSEMFQERYRGSSKK